MEIQEYLGKDGSNQFARWFGKLNAQAAVAVRRSIFKMEQGNLSNVKGVGSGVFEYRIDFGPGYRVYFGKDGEELIILLGGGSKKRQSDDIADAQVLWQEYKQRKKNKG